MHLIYKMIYQKILYCKIYWKFNLLEKTFDEKLRFS